MASLETGGAPRRNQPLAVEFMNTRYARRDGPREGIGTPEHLGAWLLEHAEQFETDLPLAALETLTEWDAERFLALRDAARGIGQALVDDEPLAASGVAILNEAAAAAPRWPQLTVTEAGRSVRERTASGVAEAARAEIARAAIGMFAGPEAELLRRCQGPGCILFYLKRHPRQGWCSEGCGTRARVSRHYYRHRE